MSAGARPKQIGRYRIDEEIGSGSAGVVYRGHDPVLERRVAIKTPKGGSPAPDDSTDPHIDFRHEAAIAGQFHHPNVVTIFDVGRDADLDYIVMEYVPGASLRELMESEGTLTLEEALATVQECCTALDFIHYHGILHRDVKPANVMVNPQRALVKLMDFSVAHRIEDTAARGRGTLAYMAPENFFPDMATDARTDVFSLGATLYELLAGKPRLSGGRRKVIHQLMTQDPPSIRDVLPDIPDSVEALLGRALAREPEHRFASALDFAEAVAAAREEQRLVSTAARAARGNARAYVGLRRCSWFERFAPEQVNEMLSVGALSLAMPGDEIVREGEPGDEFYILVEGRARAVVGGRTVNAMGVGECFGEMALVSRRPRTATVVAVEPTTLWRISREALEGVSPSSLNVFYRAFLEVMTARLDDRTRDVSELKGDLERAQLVLERREG